MQNQKTQDATERIYDLITSMWGSRAIGAIFILVVVWAASDEIVGLFS